MVQGVSLALSKSEKLVYGKRVGGKKILTPIFSLCLLHLFAVAAFKNLSTRRIP